MTSSWTSTPALKRRMVIMLQFVFNCYVFGCLETVFARNGWISWIG